MVMIGDQQLPPKRKNSSRLLFDFDTLVDLHLGVVKALQEDYPPGELSTVNYSFLHQPFEKLKQFRVFGYGKNVVQECFKGKPKESFTSIYETYLNQKRVYNRAPRTLIPRLIRVYGNSGFIKSTVLTHNVFEYQTASEILHGCNNCTIVQNANEKTIDVNQFARIHIGDIHDLDRYNPFDCTHIAVLNYGSNLQLIDHDVILLREYVIQWGDTNQFEIIDSYNDVTCPDYGRIQ